MGVRALYLNKKELRFKVSWRSEEQTWIQSASNRGNLDDLRREFADASQNEPMVLSYHLFIHGRLETFFQRGGGGIAWIKAPDLIKTANLNDQIIFFSLIQAWL